MDGREPPTGREGETCGDETDAQSALAFRHLFERYFAEVFRFVYRYVQASDVAQDLVHEAFLRLWRQRAQVDLAGPTARSYLYTIARYQALSYLRHRRVELRWQRQYSEPLLADEGPVLATGPEQEFAANETAAAILQAVEALPRRQREVLLLRWQHHASYDEIANTLGISPKTVAIHLGRAFQRLRELLAQVR